ncbi:SDR family NAD(P)-dependent oxidoreductase [Frankia sp. AiPs1]|uniref:SDR family NAD(P)-dependent oxidoreductase n=1 Tax=Frankia sp. AiPs1 TaxID=573493 RepID=UPI002044521A|nr:SDR family NAD(P)-dependent oxidoreductase [Frankia sp. AiPs1]MCM3923771.1 SDR family NAD(P)-dependent oxidoreductase [Frankia sp. AiPs1]
MTGAGRGVGAAYARALAAEGAKVVVNDLPASADRTPTSAQSVVAEIEATGGIAVAHHDSVADFDGARRVVQTAIERFGRLDILIANAAIIRPRFLRDADEHDWTDVLAVATHGTFHSLRHSVPHLIEAGGGTIIVTGDLVTDVHFPRNAAYRAAKAANAVLASYAAEELRPFGISVNAVNPGATATALHDDYVASLVDHAKSFRAELGTRVAAVGAALPPPAAPETVPPLGIYLCTEEGRRITGRAFQLNGTSIGVATTRTEISYLDPDVDVPAGWSTAALAARLPAWLAGGPGAAAAGQS